MSSGEARLLRVPVLIPAKAITGAGDPGEGETGQGLKTISVICIPFARYRVHMKSRFRQYLSK